MGWLVRNWHLKLSAVLLATVLYTGLVFSGSFREDTLQVRIEQANVSRDAFVLSGDLGLVQVRYRASTDQLSNVTADDFVAQVDMAAYDMERSPEPQQLPVTVRSLRDGIAIIEIEPREVRVQVDRIAVRTIDVEVEPGKVPDGLEIGRPVTSPDQVEVRGPASIVEQIDRAVALISIPASGIDVNEAVDVTPVDISGQPIGAGMIDVDPETVSVQVDVRAVETRTTVAIRPTVRSGAPAPGFALEALSVDPSVVTIVGVPERLSQVTSIATDAISIDGLSESESFDVALELPDGISLAPGEPSEVTVTATIVPSVSSRTFVVGILCAGAGDNGCLPDIEQVSITLSGSGEAMAALSAADVTPFVNVAGLAPGTYNLSLSLGDLPPGVRLLGISPSVVRVTIVEPEPTPTPVPSP